MQWVWIWGFLLLFFIGLHTIQCAGLSIMWQGVAVARTWFSCFQLLRWYLWIYCTQILKDYRRCESVNQGINWPTSFLPCLEEQGFIPTHYILKSVSLIFISEKYFADRLLPLQRLTSNKNVYGEKLNPVRAFSALLLASASHFFSLNFSFQQFHLTGLMICLPSINQINQRGQKPRQRRNRFVLEISGDWAWLCTELCALGFRSSRNGNGHPSEIYS